ILDVPGAAAHRPVRSVEAMKTAFITTLSVLGVVGAASAAMAANAQTLGVLDPQSGTSSSVVSLTGDEAPLGAVPTLTAPPASTAPATGFPVDGSTGGSSSYDDEYDD